MTMADNGRMDVRDYDRCIKAAKLRIEQLEQQLDQRDKTIEELRKTLWRWQGIADILADEKMNAIDENERLRTLLAEKDAEIERWKKERFAVMKATLHAKEEEIERLRALLLQRV
jgi:TolA-binding protein